MNTDPRRPRNGHYNAEFKRQTVELLLKSGRKLKPLARELGISPPTLRWWRDQYLSDTTPQGRVHTAGTLEEMRAQNEQLRRENETLRAQRDILKKPWASSRKRRREVCHDPRLGGRVCGRDAV